MLGKRRPRGESGLAASILQGLLRRSALWRDLNWDLHKFGSSLGQPTCSNLTRSVSMLWFSFGDTCKRLCFLLANTYWVWEVLTTSPVSILNYFCQIFSPFHHLPNIKYSYCLFFKSQEWASWFTNSNEENCFPSTMYISAIFILSLSFLIFFLPSLTKHSLHNSSRQCGENRISMEKKNEQQTEKTPRNFLLIYLIK